MPCNRLLSINLTEAKIANELIRQLFFSSFTQYPASHFTQLSCVLFPGLRYRLFMCGFRFWSITRREISTFVIDVESQQHAIFQRILFMVVVV